MFLMPSRFEPCGLNQMYSLKYGTVPVVRATGGLADTIVDATPGQRWPPARPTASASASTALALSETLRRACDVCHRPDVWQQLIATGMQQDWSWTRSAEQYVGLYQKTLQRMKLTAGRD